MLSPQQRILIVVWMMAATLCVIGVATADGAQPTPPATASSTDTSALTLADRAAYSGPAWSPYLVGALIGVLSMVTFYFSNKPLGTSTAYATVAGKLGNAVAPQHTHRLKYFADNQPKIDWQVLLVIGVIIGGFLAALSGGEWTGRFLPPMWVKRFGAESWGLRAIAAVSGGVLMAFGARMAGGCTSGHGISGTLQLAIGSWVTVICMFIGGIVVAMSMFVWTF